MLHTFTKCSFLLLFLLFGFSSQAQVSYTWTGSVSTDWNAAGNWSPAGVPATPDNATIPGTGITNWPVLSSNISIYNLEFNSGSKIDTRGNIITTLNRTWILGATINNTNAGSVIEFNFKNGGAYIGSSIFFGDVNINNDASINNWGSQTQIIFEGYQGGNQFNGDLKITSVGEYGNIYLSQDAKSVFKGNVEVISEGYSTHFWKGAIINGNLKIVGTTNGDFYIGSSTSTTEIGGKLDIIIPIGSNIYETAYVKIDHVTNQTSGGEINLQNSSLRVENSTLKLKYLKRTGYGEADVNENFIEGNVFVESRSNSRWTGNEITGSTDFIISLTDGWFTDVNNYFKGEVSYNFKGDQGTFYHDVVGGASWRSRYTKNITILGTKYLTSDFGLNEDQKIILAGPGITTLKSYPVPNLSIEKTDGGKVILDLEVKGQLTFVTGIVEGNISCSSWSGASDVSHVTGIIASRKTAFTFPVGSGIKFHPVTVSNPSASVISVQYFAEQPTLNGYNTALKSTSLHSVWNGGYWDIKKFSEIGNVSVSLGYNVPSGYITDQSKLRVAHWNGSIWEDLGNGGTSGSLTVGTVTTAAGVTSFSPFTIASADASNPLPVKLVKFSVQKENETALLQWSTTEELNSDRFEIENSLDAINWQKIGEAKATGESTVLSHYQFVDKTPFSGLNYYRLKMIDADGTFAYSRIESIKLSSAAQTVMYPNPVSDRLFFETTKGVSILKVNLTNSNGIHVLAANNADLNEGIDLSKFPAGIYFVNITLSDSRVETHKVFVK